ncbi:MAG: hypothetical protein KDA24_25475 [Deltaproteobacteria bacterium]|nr:hypothetical protein [Deltaproteobacteria bacterium]
MVSVYYIPSASRFAPLLLVALLALASGCATTYTGRSISGRILGKAAFGPTEEPKPVENARIQIQVKEPSVKKPEEGPRFKLPHGIDALTNLRGVSVTTTDGAYLFDSLFTPWVDEEDHPLLRGWTYSVEIVAPGYYIYEEEFVYDGEPVQAKDFVLERKPNDVQDKTGGVSENPHLMRPTTAKRFE